MRLGTARLKPGTLVFPPLGKIIKALQFQWLDGERAGTRTQDPLIKSQMLYRLSYALPEVSSK